MWRSWLRILGAAVLVMLAAVMAVRAYSPGGFDAARWQALRNSDARDNPRVRMVSDLARLLRPGMTRGDVLALLGEPEARRDGRFLYALGASPYGVDYEYFAIEFAGDRLVRHALTRG
jgi:hypothetical protein